MPGSERMVEAWAQEGQRLDQALAAASGESRSFVERFIREGQVFVDGIVISKPGFRLKEGQQLRLCLPSLAPACLQPENLNLNILYQDADLAVINKPCGMVVYPAAGHDHGTLVNGLLHQLDSLSTLGGPQRPGIVHRLDKDTSGLILIAKNDRAHAFFTEALAQRQVKRCYLAVVYGVFREDEGSIDAPIARNPKDRKRMAVVEGGKHALTQWKLQKPLRSASLLEVSLITGRTHQIRVHMAWRNHPVLGDPLYGNQHAAAPRLMLHAFQLGFRHPSTGEYREFEAAPEEVFQRQITKMEV